MTRNLEYDVRGRDIPRDLFPNGRVRFSLGVSSKQEARRRRERMQDLRRWHAWDILHGISEGVLHVSGVCRMLAQQGEAALPELRSKLAREVEGSIPTVAQEAERYLEWYERNREPQSHRQVKSRLKRFGEQESDEVGLIRDLLLTDVTRRTVERGMRAVSDHPTTQEGIRLAVSGLYSWSIEEEGERARKEGRSPRWTVNPASKVERPTDQRSTRVARPRKPTATDEQAQALLSAGQLYERAYLRAFLHLGLRLDELIHTRLHEDLDLTTWAWEIQARDADERCGCPQCSGPGWSPKTKRSVRTLIVPEVKNDQGEEILRSTIREYLELTPAEPGDFVFRNPRTSNLWSDSSLVTDFQAVCKTAGVRYGRDTPGGLTIHTLRHTAATNLIRAGVRESVVAAILGDTVETIVRYYVQLEPEDLADGISRGPAYL